MSAAFFASWRLCGKLPSHDGMPPDAYNEEHSDIDLLSAAPAPFDPDAVEPFACDEPDADGWGAARSSTSAAN